MSRAVILLVLAIAMTPVQAFAEEAAAAAKSARPCQEAGSDKGSIEGRLRLFEGMGPAAFIVALPGGLCLTGSPEVLALGTVTTVQLYAPTADGMQRLYGLVGQRIVARGKLNAGATFQQKAPVLMEVFDVAVK